MRICLLTVVLLGGVSAMAQVSQQRGGYVDNTAGGSFPPATPIFQYSMHLKTCRISEDAPGTTVKFHKDHDLCRVESHTFSEHWEDVLVKGKKKQKDVRVEEMTVVLQNNRAQTVTYLVDQRLPKSWTVDSTPQPVMISGRTATFKVVAQPGQTVRLHVGERQLTDRRVAYWTGGQ